MKKRNCQKSFLFVRNAENHRNQIRDNQRIIGTCLISTKNVNAAANL